MEKSFSNPRDKFESENSLLQEDKNKAPYDAIYLAPAIFLDKDLVKEELSEVIITSAICSKLKKQPEICDKFKP